MTSPQLVDAYIASKPEDVQRVLERVRASIRRALPRAKELISYQMPTYKLDDVAVIYFAGWKEHYSLYPASAALVAEFEDDLAKYEVNKGTIRLPLTEPVPTKLIERIARFRAAEVAKRARPARSPRASR